MSQPNPSAAQGFLLLTLPNVRLSAPWANPPEQTGRLSLECVTIPVGPAGSSIVSSTPTGTTSPATQRDVWLVLRIGNFEEPLSASDAIYHSRQRGTYTFRAPEGQFMITLQPPASVGDTEDHETFEVLLQQYGSLQEVDPSDSKRDDTRDVKGRLVLVDEDDGEVVGTLGEQFTIREDPGLAQGGKAPVVIEMPEEGQTEIRVHAMDPDEQDFILRSAQFISRGIVFATDMIGKGMGMASEYYVKNNAPNAEPMVFSESTKRNLKRIHGISGQAVKVSTHTTGLIHGLIDKAADRVAGKPKTPHPSTAYAPGATPPPLPPRGGPAARGPTPSPGPPSGAGTPPPLPPRRRMLNRLLMSTDLILTTLENSAHTLVTTTTTNLSTTLGHKYGPEMGTAVTDVGQALTNVGVVYIDVRGVGRRALIKRAGKRVIKGKMGKRHVVLGAEGLRDDGSVIVDEKPQSVPGGWKA
ncbi:hypothetical protein FS837_000984 [Tulasnella sp. UAMH 9824]|nr:hypothetical protein FS837_000984 [Tulasnella sp. UAMH 9824]